jgi:hypothetical protein
MAKGTSGGSGGGARGGLARPVQPSKELAEITGSDPLPRSQVVSKMWDYIRNNNLQNPENKREIVLRRDTIAGLYRDEGGHWVARLSDGGEQRIGRSYTDEVKRLAGR